MDELRNCSSKQAIEKKFRSLPKDLDETYRRIIDKIDESDRDDVKVFMQWLCFSVDAMRLVEIAEVATVDFKSLTHPRYDPERRYRDPEDVARKCASFVIIRDNGGSAGALVPLVPF